MKLNYPAILVSAIAYWMLGALWYGLLFGARWMVLENITVEQARAGGSALPYLISFVLDLLIAFVLAQWC